MGRETTNPEHAREDALKALGELRFGLTSASEVVALDDASPEWGQILISLLEAARYAGVDLEGALRARALLLLSEIRSREEFSKN